MKHLIIKLILVAATGLVSWAGHAQSTAFTYQGRLTDSTGPVTGLHDFEFRMFNAATGAAQQGPTVTLDDLGVTNGLFTATLDFGANFPGADRFLQIAVRPGASTGAYTPLNPRQLITPTPYAVKALEAAGLPAGAVSGVMLMDGAVTGAKLGSGAVTADKIADGTITATDLSPSGFNTTFWRASGNAGTTAGTHFLGTTDDQVLEFRVNGQRALRLEPRTFSPNVIGGYSGNILSNSVRGGFIAGGGNIDYPNVVGADYASVLGGFGNVARGVNATAFGNQSEATGPNSTAFGSGARAINDYAVAMGGGTLAGGRSSTAMGESTVANGSYSTAMGYLSQANGDFSLAAGQNVYAYGATSVAMGYGARAWDRGSFVWADAQFGNFASTTSNQFSIRASGGVRLNNDTSLNFGNQTRQMINLWSADFGIGVQSDTTYFRTGGEFSWFRGGSHEDGSGDPGMDGYALMRLDRNGNLGLGISSPPTRLMPCKARRSDGSPRSAASMAPC